MAGRRGKVARRFSDTSLEVLVAAVRARRGVLFPQSGKKVHSSLSKKGWLEVAEEVSRLSVTPRTWIQCRKRFNDLTRSAREKTAHNMRERNKIGAGTADIVILTQAEQAAMDISGTFRAISIGDGEAGGLSKHGPPPQQQPPQEAPEEDTSEEDIPTERAQSRTPSLRSTSAEIPTPDGIESELEGPAPGETHSTSRQEQVLVAGPAQETTRRRAMSPPSSAEWDRDADFRDPAMKRKMLEAHYRLYEVLEGLPQTLSTMSESMEESTSTMCGVVSHVISTLQSTLECATTSRDTAAEPSQQESVSPTIEALMEAQTAAIQTLGSNVCSTLERLVCQMDRMVDHVDRGFQRVTHLLQSALPQISGSDGSAKGQASVALSQDGTAFALSTPPQPIPATVPDSRLGQTALAAAEELQSAAAPSRARPPRVHRPRASQGSQHLPQQPTTSFAVVTGGASRRSCKVGLSH
ncbi:uncharacterized protein [Heptranchias perlo]|uniref:uncharacterized protein isoform X1 n=1 Tax=Heptranchias perlo TaxID=212740 RepID=UPI00355AAB96